MLKKIIKSTFENITNITLSTNSISSNCKSISFFNNGDENAKIYINDTDHSHDGGYIPVLASSAVSLPATGEKAIVTDVFDVVFSGGGTPSMAIIRENQELI